MQSFIITLLLFISIPAFSQEKDEYAGFRASLDKAYEYEASHPKEYPQKGYWRGWLYIDSTRQLQFSTETGDSVVNRSDGSDVNISIYRQDVRMTIRMGYYGNKNLEEYARASRKELETKFPQTATNTKQDKLKQDKKNFTWYYTRHYTHNGRNYAMLVAFRLMYKVYNVAITTAIFYDDDQADRRAEQALKTAETISPI